MWALLSLQLFDFMQVLRQVTRENPCCKILEDVMRQRKPAEKLKLGDFAGDKHFMLNLPLLIVDIKEYLVGRRVVQLENVANSYLSNSIEYMQACKAYQSNLLRSHLQEILKDTRILQDKPAFRMAQGDTVKLVSHHHSMAVPDLVKQLDGSKTHRLEHVNEYWKQSNQMVTEFVG